jgi:1-acyl-sn-glycerol-3-phosphate acyltransferase
VDPVVLGALSPSVPIAKREIGDWPILGRGCRALGVLFVDRGDAHSGARVLRASARALAAGVPVLGFPEGTTSSGHSVLPFRRGMFGLARIAEVPVVPVALRYARDDVAWTGDAAFVPHYLRTLARAETRVDIVIGRPLHADGSDPEDLAGEARHRIDRMLRS